MDKIKKLFLPFLIVLTVFLIYKFYFAPTDTLGSFSKFSTSSEINQEINVEVLPEKGFSRNQTGQITSFFVKDINNKVTLVSLHEPISNDIINAKVVELLGHMHNNSFTAARVTILE